MPGQRHVANTSERSEAWGCCPSRGRHRLFAAAGGNNSFGGKGNRIADSCTGKRARREQPGEVIRVRIEQRYARQPGREVRDMRKKQIGVSILLRGNHGNASRDEIGIRDVAGQR